MDLVDDEMKTKQRMLAIRSWYLARWLGADITPGEGLLILVDAGGSAPLFWQVDPDAFRK
jgi:hypothetical protein